MKFGTIGHLIDEKTIDLIPKNWVNEKYIVSPEMDIKGTKGHLIVLKKTAKEVMNLPKEEIRQIILDAAIYAQNEYRIDLIQLGALTTSVTSGGNWLINQPEYKGYITHGDSYTAAVTCQAVNKILEIKKEKSMDLSLAIVGAYGIIGEAISKKLASLFKKTILIGPKIEKLYDLTNKINGNYEISTDLRTNNADAIITATNHPAALLDSQNLKKNAIVIDVSQPPNLSMEICINRPDVIRVDGGIVNFPADYPIPGLPKGKILACIAELIMQALEDENKNHINSINLKHLNKTEKWAKKHGFELKELTNFGFTI